MFEIIIAPEQRSGVFLSPSFKYDLEMNHAERGTLIATKLLHAFFTEYDLAYAGDVLSSNGKPGIDHVVLAAIESKHINCIYNTSLSTCASLFVNRLKMLLPQYLFLYNILHFYILHYDRCLR